MLTILALIARLHIHFALHRVFSDESGVLTVLALIARLHIHYALHRAFSDEGGVLTILALIARLHITLLCTGRSQMRVAC